LVLRTRHRDTIPPAVAEYLRAADNVVRARSIHVLDAGTTGIAALTVFLDPGPFTAFGLSPITAFGLSPTR
jgi:hypothetical protein